MSKYRSARQRRHILAQRWALSAGFCLLLMLISMMTLAYVHDTSGPYWLGIASILATLFSLGAAVLCFCRATELISY